MPDIQDYVETTKVILGETAKYFALLLFSVLAIRLWRRWSKSPAASRFNDLLLAGVVTVVAAVVGYVSLCQSLGKLYSHYGMNALRANRLPQAFTLFETSSKYWNSADVLGQKGVCFLLSGHPDQGLQLIGEAKALRRGHGTPLEDFYAGLYLFTLRQYSNSVPLLEAAAADGTYRWSVVKIFAVMDLDENRTAEAAGLMKPFLQAEITESDQAYIVAALKLADGKKAEAQAILNKFPPDDLSPMWKARFEKLQAEIHH